jgi:hypothetical protein
MCSLNGNAGYFLDSNYETSRKIYVALPEHGCPINVFDIVAILVLINLL